MNTKDTFKKLSALPESDMVGRMTLASELANDKETSNELLKYGRVPILYRPTKSMVRKPMEPGILNLINMATTEREINNLILKGKTDYKEVHPKTVKMWETAAKIRIIEINNK